jgi:hypothetical protein
MGEQLRQRAAMGGEQERAGLAAFEAMIAKSIADALVALAASGPFKAMLERGRAKSCTTICSPSLANLGYAAARPSLVIKRTP